MTTYTNSQLMAVWAKLLPDKVFWYLHPSTQVRTLFWNNNDPRFIESVTPTEMLALCEMVEEALTGYQRSRYANKLCILVGNALFAEYDPSYSPLHASWQQKTQALCAVKGVEID